MSKKHTSQKTPFSRTAIRELHRKRKQRSRRSWLWGGLGALALIAVLVLLLLPRNEASVEITASEAYQKYQQGVLFLDVRSVEEWEQAHVSGSITIPLDELSSRLGELPTEEEMVVICQSGLRSKQGITILQEAGFDQVSCLTGGLDVWEAAGYPLESGAP